MADAWETAVKTNDAVKFAGLVLTSSASPEAALAIVRSCAAVLGKEQAPSPTIAGAVVGGPVSPPSTSNGQHPDPPNRNAQPLLCTLEGVQLLHPRGRFILEFRKSGVTITGKAATVSVSWDNVRHVIRLPRPEGFNWGRSLDQDDPAGSDLLALPLKEPVPLRKSEATLVLLQPDPKARHAEVSLSLDGVSHKVSGSQGTVIAGLLKLLCGVKQSLPDKGLFVSRGGKSFVKCYFGVNEGSLFPLRQGLFFMKPALFLPKGDIEQVVCGRGGSATTRYVDLVVGMEAGEDDKQSTREFSNIEREDLPSLQNYIQDALVAPRLREAKKAAKAEAAAAAASSPPLPDPPETVKTTATETVMPTSTSEEPTLPSSSSKDDRPSRRAAGVGRESGVGAGEEGGKRAASEVASSGVARADEEEEEDDGDAESDEDFAPVPGDTDSDDDSESSVSSASGGSDDDSDGDSEGEGGDDNEEEDEDGGGDVVHEGRCSGKGDEEDVSDTPAEKRKRMDEGGVDGKLSLHMSKSDDDDTKGGDETESDEEGRKKKRAA